MNNAIYNNVGEKLAGDASLPESLPKALLQGSFPVLYEGCLFSMLDNGQISAIRNKQDSGMLLHHLNITHGTVNKEKLLYGLLYGQFGIDETIELCKKQHFIYEKTRIVITISLNETAVESNIYAILEQLFKEGEAETLTANEHETVLIYEGSETDEEVMDLCGAIRETINNELQTDAHIGIGSFCRNASGLYAAYQHSLSALSVGRRISFYGGVWVYSRLFVELLLADLSREVLNKHKSSLSKLADAVDEDTAAVLEELFAQNFNISKTARRLYMHRNTLIYRLDKLEKSTGLDMRKFDDAVALRLFIAIQRLNQ